MRICAAVFDVQIPYATSLKDKRKVVKGLIDSIRAKYNVSAMEVEFQDKWQRAAVGIVWISITPQGEDSLFDKMRNDVIGREGLVLLGIERNNY